MVYRILGASEKTMLSLNEVHKFVAAGGEVMQLQRLLFRVGRATLIRLGLNEMRRLGLNEIA